MPMKAVFLALLAALVAHRDVGQTMTAFIAWRGDAKVIKLKP